MRSPSLSALLALLIAVLLGACASAPPLAEQRPEPLLADARFGPPTEPVSTDRVFEVSDAMRRYLQNDIAPSCARRARRKG